MPSELPGRCAACAARDVALCAGLGSDDLAALHAIGRRRSLSAGEVFAWAGDPAAVCGNLVSGVLKIARSQPDGHVQIVGLLYPGDFVGELFVDRTSDTTGALTDADLCIYPRAALEEVLAGHPSARRLLLRRTLATLMEARRWMPMLARGRAEARVAALLIDMARRCAARDDRPFALLMSRGDMGEALGLAIETVSRQITALQDAGLIALSGARGVRLLDPAGLARIAG